MTGSVRAAVNSAASCQFQVSQKTSRRGLCQFLSLPAQEVEDLSAFLQFV